MHSPRPLALVTAALVAAAAIAFVAREDAPRRGGAALGPAPGQPAGDGAARDGAALEADLARLDVGAPDPARDTAVVEPSEGSATALEVRAIEAKTRRPVEAFFVTVLPAGVSAQGRGGVALVSGALVGALSIEVQGPEHEAVVRALEPPYGPSVTVELPQRTGVRGIVRFADARPAPDIALRLTPVLAEGADGPQAQVDPSVSAPKATFPTLAKSGPDGRYRFAPLPPGRYVVSAEHLGRTVATLAEVEVRAGLTELPDVRLEAGARLEIEALDAGSQPRAEALVVVMPADGAAVRRYTDRDGKVVLEPLPLGRYTIVVPAQAGIPEARKELELLGGLLRETFRADTFAPAAGRKTTAGGR
ncbi:MAG: carboxypeptidase-like regulatory domain-containing protein [Planctomycetota bacterium]